MFCSSVFDPAIKPIIFWPFVVLQLVTSDSPGLVPAHSFLHLLTDALDTCLGGFGYQSGDPLGTDKVVCI